MTKKKKATWTAKVQAFNDGKMTWKVLGVFDHAKDADACVTAYVRAGNCLTTDVTIIYKEN